MDGEQIIISFNPSIVAITFVPLIVFGLTICLGAVLANIMMLVYGYEKKSFK